MTQETQESQDTQAQASPPPAPAKQGWWARKPEESKHFWRVAGTTTVVLTVCFTLAAFRSPLPDALTARLTQRVNNYKQESEARDQVMANLERYSQQVTGMVQETPGAEGNKAIGLVAPTEPPKLPELTPEQHSALTQDEIAAYKRMQARAYNFLPRMQIPEELLQPVALTCAASDYVVTRRDGPVMPVDQYDPGSNAPLAPARGQTGGDIFNPQVAARANSPDKAFSHGASVARSRLGEAADTVREISGGLSEQQMQQALDQAQRLNQPQGSDTRLHSPTSSPAGSPP